MSAAEAHRTSPQAVARRSCQAVLVSPGHLEMRPFDPPHPGPGELLIEVRCALSCGTDLKAFRRGHPMWPMPTPFGHEFSGIVAEAGPDVRDFKAGDELMAAPTAPCGRCFLCKRGAENLCPLCMEKMALGAYADFLLLPAHVVATNAFRKPVDLPFDEAALLEPIACVLHALDIAQPRKSETALVIGAGAFGLLHVLALRAAGVRRVAVVGRRKPRLRSAGEIGADVVIDAEGEDVAQAVSGLNDGHGPDLAIDCTGQVEGWHAAFSWVRRGGRALLFGGCAPGTALSIDTRRMHYDNLSLLAPFHFRPRDVRSAFELLRGRELGAARVINQRRPLSKLGEVFAMHERGEVLKCAVLPGIEAS